MKEREKENPLWVCFLNPTELKLLSADKEADRKLSVLIQKGQVQQPGFVLQILTMQQQETP